MAATNPIAMSATTASVVRGGMDSGLIATVGVVRALPGVAGTGPGATYTQDFGVTT